MSESPRNSLPAELSPRQHQILKLLQAGKVNKEVAQELGIGLGTVKQHLVAIFKKLNVSNRAMAATQAMEMFHEHESRTTTFPMSDLLECRPCVVLSVALPQQASPLALKLMYGSLASAASLNDAVFLARNGNACDLIFGIQRVSEYDLAIALQAARSVYDDLLEFDRAEADTLHGCMTAGIAFASMKRFGGWTGEAIASSAIASARELLGDVSAGQFLFDTSALDLIELFGIGGAQPVLPSMLFNELRNVHWTGARRAYHLVGRVNEIASLYGALTESGKGNGKLAFVEGEMGMGKSSLCNEIAKLCIQQNGSVMFCRCLPSILGKHLYDTTHGTEFNVDEVATLLYSKPEHLPDLAVIDDFHLLSKEQQLLLSNAAKQAVDNGKLVIFSGRRWVVDSDNIPSKVIVLRRLTSQAIQTLVRNALGKGTVKERASTVQRISTAASGVPLFAVELARHHETELLTLPLRVAVNARLDSLHLDRSLLREVAKTAAGCSLEEVATRLGEALESLQPNMQRAVAAGVLNCSTENWLSFTHPLLRRAMHNLDVE